MGSVLCEHCTAACCRYIALPIEKPRTPRDFDDIRWYLMHENVGVFVEDGTWFIQFYTRCKNLQPDNRCGIYATRPTICREYKAGDCDYAGGDYDYEHWFTHPSQIDDYLRERQQKKRRAVGRARGPKPPTSVPHVMSRRGSRGAPAAIARSRRLLTGVAEPVLIQINLGARPPQTSLKSEICNLKSAIP